MNDITDRIIATVIGVLIGLGLFWVGHTLHDGLKYQSIKQNKSVTFKCETITVFEDHDIYGRGCSTNR